MGHFNIQNNIFTKNVTGIRANSDYAITHLTGTTSVNGLRNSDAPSAGDVISRQDSAATLSMGCGHKQTSVGGDTSSRRAVGGDTSSRRAVGGDTSSRRVLLRAKIKTVKMTLVIVLGT